MYNQSNTSIFDTLMAYLYRMPSTIFALMFEMLSSRDTITLLLHPCFELEMSVCYVQLVIGGELKNLLIFLLTCDIIFLCTTCQRLRVIEFLIERIRDFHEIRFDRVSSGDVIFQTQFTDSQEMINVA